MQERTIDNILKTNLNTNQLKEFNRIYYGREDHCELDLNDTTLNLQDETFEVKGFRFSAALEELRKPRLVKLGLIQHSIIKSTAEPVEIQRKTIYEKVGRIIKIAATEGVNIICLQETWSMPFFLCTKEKLRWSEFAESTKNGPSIEFLTRLARKHRIVIVSPILEVDAQGVWWNTAVVINEEGKILGSHRKNHLPSVGSFSETPFYAPGNTGHPVFETKYGRIAVNICYGRHHALNWLMFGLNGAEIVFNPAATIAEFGESFWGIEARNAAAANGYFTCSINRVGTEDFKIGAKEENRVVSRTYYGSSYVTAPDGSRTPSLSRVKDGLMIIEADLNLCRQVKDQSGFNMTSRLPVYAKALENLYENK